ncbi:hypothetical protein GQ44DRAFT_447058 [Phaeosphaeriaceae sp. PMI808]|nr:hypothetical protein GQ44DRAFT_447058 [Phaeosphaeriaceae sp. PMI808]
MAKPLIAPSLSRTAGVVCVQRPRLCCIYRMVSSPMISRTSESRVMFQGPRKLAHTKKKTPTFKNAPFDYRAKFSSTKHPWLIPTVKLTGGQNLRSGKDKPHAVSPLSRSSTQVVPQDENMTCINHETLTSLYITLHFPLRVTGQVPVCERFEAG